MTVVAQALAAMAEAKTEIERLRAINAELINLIDRARWKLHTFVHIYTGDKELRGLLDDWEAALVAHGKGKTP